MSYFDDVLNALAPSGYNNESRIKELLQSDPKFAEWKRINAPQDSGRDYDLYGAYKAGLQPSQNHHFPDMFKLPNHPRFSIESQFYRPGMPSARWGAPGENGGPAQDNYIPMTADEAAAWVKANGQNADPQIKSLREIFGQ